MGNRVVAASLVGVIASLLILGLVSGPILWHVVLAVPAILAVAVVVGRPVWGRYAAMAIFIFWFASMGLVWLLVPKIAERLGGHLTPIELVLSIIIGGCCAVGAVAALRSKDTARSLTGILVFAAAFLMQMVATWLSF